MTDPIHTDDNSFEEYKKYLEESIGVLNLKPPSRPMNAFMRYFFERSCEERSKGNKQWAKMTGTISEEWKKLPANKKQYYDKIAQLRMTERNQIYEEYQKLAKKKKPATAWSRFFKKRYSVYAKEHPSYSAKEITKLVNSDWRNIAEKEKTKLQKQYEEEKALYQAKADNTQRIDRYKELVQKFNQDLNEEKQKILKKYGLSKQALEKQKLLKKTQDQQRRTLESQQRRRLKNEKRRKERQEKARKEKDEKDQLKKQKQQVVDKEKQKFQEEKARAKSTDKPLKVLPKVEEPVQQKKSQVKVVAPTTVKREKSVSKGKVASTPTSKKAPAPKKVAVPKKTKQIQKAPKKPAAKKVLAKPAKKISEPVVKKQAPVPKPAKKPAAKVTKSVAKGPAKKVVAKRGKK